MKQQFTALDGIRGIAAIAVMVHHGHRLFPSSLAMPSAYLAVDLFFVLSGFVIAHAYDDRFKAGMSVGDFIAFRWARLYPMFFAGLCFGGVAEVLAGSFGHGTRSLGFISAAFASGLFLIPHPISVHDQLFPLNGPSWSLLFEIVVNGVFAATFPLMRTWTVAAVVGIAAVMLAALSLWDRGLDLGATPDTVFGGAARVTFGFFAGVLIYRLRWAPIISGWSSALATVIIVALLAFDPPSSFRPAYDVFVVIFLIPTLVGTIAWRPLPVKLEAVGRWLGNISYPAYLIHIPLLFVFAGLAERVMSRPIEAMTGWIGFVYLAVCCGGAHLIEVVYDRPARERLKQFVRRANLRSRPRAFQ